jgi:eukaryotic-like serine/threonine-protein kinase
MGPGSSPQPTPQLDDFIERFEAAQAERGPVDLKEFLPDAAHPLFHDVLRELVRIDLETGWERGRPARLEDYRTRFPGLFQDPASLREIAFEEYRLRCQAGESPSPSEYRARFGVDPAGWPANTWDATPRPDDRAILEKLSASSTPVATPVAKEDGMVYAARAYQQFRQGERSAHAIDLKDWLTASVGPSVHAGLLLEIHDADPDAAQRLAQSVTRLPSAGMDWLGFLLIAELGRGAFSRVFLARQGDLANRPVALKIAAGLFDESQALAQLQHTHIVPIYSVHRDGALQAVCMPYFGALTLADVLKGLREQAAPRLGDKELVKAIAYLRDLRERALPAGAIPRAPTSRDLRNQGLAPGDTSTIWKHLEQLTYIDAILWLTARLADGLAHAHERGILHRDVKPANVLLTDEGQPMWLDFNLAEDVKARSYASAAFIGGSLPYMAPEHLQAFAGQSQTVDARCDIYSLGVMLFEMLTGRLPFAVPEGRLRDGIAGMVEERMEAPPEPRLWNPAIPTAVQTIVRRCLEPNPALRYQTARELQEDLQRQLQNQPLRHAPEPSWQERTRKWLRRHPRFVSSVTVWTIAAACLVALAILLVMRSQRMASRDAEDSLRQFRADLLPAQFVGLNHPNADPEGLEEGVRVCRDFLDRYHIVEDSDWMNQEGVRALSDRDRDDLLAEAGALLLLSARLTFRHALNLSDPSARRAEAQEALRLNERAETCYAAAEVPQALWRQRAELCQELDRGEEARRLRRQAAVTPARSAREHALLADEWSFQGRYREALPLLRDAARLDPRAFWIWFDLGVCHENLAQDAEAAACFGTCIALAPDFAPLYLKRALALNRLGDNYQAFKDVDAALRLDRKAALHFLDSARRAGCRLEGRAEDPDFAVLCAVPELERLLKQQRPGTP